MFRNAHFPSLERRGNWFHFRDIEKMNVTFARKPHAFHRRTSYVTTRDRPQRTKSSDGAFLSLVQAKLRIGLLNDNYEQAADLQTDRASPDPTIHRKVGPGAVDCANDPPRRIRTDTPLDEIRSADWSATSMLHEAIRQLELVRSGGADDRLLLFAYLRLKRYFGLFGEDFRPPVGEELRARFEEFMVTSFLDSLIIRLRDRMQKMLESGDLEYECLAGRPCGGKVHAWSVFGEPFIHLCRRFWESDTNERALTIIHELYHIVSEEADDEGVGVANAHCIEGFVGSLAGSPKLREGGCKTQ